MPRTCEGLGRKGRQATEELIRKKAMEVVCVCVCARRGLVRY